jgi:hypothetical protein
MIKATRNTCEYYLLLSEVENEANSYNVKEKAKRDKNMSLAEMVFPEERAFNSDVKEHLDALMPEDKPDTSHPLNDYMVEECGGGEGIHYLWFTIYAKYDDANTWKKISDVLKLDSPILPVIKE